MKRLASAVAVAVVMLFLVFPSTAPASPAPEPHPEIHAAIESLRNAREHLQHARHDFGGHRVDAIHSIDEAIHQLQICMQYDN